MLVFEIYPAGSFIALSFALLLGLLVGSFLNVVIYRLPIMMEREWQEALAAEQLSTATQPETLATPPAKFNLATPRSRCSACQHMIHWYENIPVVSYVFLKGRCSACQTKISLRYPIIEIISALLCAGIAWQLGITITALALMGFTWALITLTMIDIDHQLLPDSITLPLLWAGLVVNSFELFTSLEAAVWGAIAGYLCLWSIYWAFKLLTGKEGMGYGDFKLLGALGAWGGIASLPIIILLSSIVALIIALCLIAFKKHTASNPLPFGPYLAIAGWIAILFHHAIYQWYLTYLLNV